MEKFQLSNNNLIHLFGLWKKIVFVKVIGLSSFGKPTMKFIERYNKFLDCLWDLVFFIIKMCRVFYFYLFICIMFKVIDCVYIPQNYYFLLCTREIIFILFLCCMMMMHQNGIFFFWLSLMRRKKSIYFQTLWIMYIAISRLVCIYRWVVDERLVFFVV